jgi:hypothetical protein
MKGMLLVAAVLVCYSIGLAEPPVLRGLGMFGEEISLEQREARINVLKSRKLPVTGSGNPTLAELLDLVNSALLEDGEHFQVAVHVSPERAEWWDVARKLKLSELVFNSFGANKMEHFLASSSAWSLFNLICENLAICDPLFSDSWIVLSPEIGFKPYTLAEHLPEKSSVPTLEIVINYKSGKPVYELSRGHFDEVQIDDRIKRHARAYGVLGSVRLSIAAEEVPIGAVIMLISKLENHGFTNIKATGPGSRSIRFLKNHEGGE